MSRPPLLRAVFAASACCLVTSLPAQVAWQLPPGGAAVYERDRDIEYAKLDEYDIRLGSVDEAHPVVFEGELDDHARRIVRNVHSFHGVGPACAFDLALAPGRQVVRRFPNIEHFGEIVATIRRERRAPVTGGEAGGDAQQDGTHVLQELRVTLRQNPGANKASSRRGGPDEELARLYAWYHQGTVKGGLRIVRRIDLQRGLVESFTIEHDYVASQKTGIGMQRAKVTGSETWTLREVLVGTDDAFEVRIGEAIDLAAGWLRTQLREEKDLWTRDESPGPTIGPSLHAHFVRGLGDAGIGVGDPLVAQRLDELLQRDMQHPRALLETLLALEAVHGDSAARRRALRTGRSVGDVVIPAELRRRVQQIADALVDTYGRRESSEEELVYGHHAGQGSSVDWTGRVAEGLLAAARLGARVPARVWPALTRSIVKRQTAAVAERAEWTTREGVQRTREVAGWSSGTYRGAQIDGKATCISIAALLGLRTKLNQAAPELVADLDRSVELGIGWLALNYSARQNPSRLSNDFQWADSYFEYLPRAMERAGVTKLGRRDWFFETSLNLLIDQKRPGGNAGFSIAGTTTALQVWLGRAGGPITGRGR